MKGVMGVDVVEEDSVTMLHHQTDSMRSPWRHVMKRVIVTMKMKRRKTMVDDWYSDVVRRQVDFLSHHHHSPHSHGMTVSLVVVRNSVWPMLMLVHCLDVVQPSQDGPSIPGYSVQCPCQCHFVRRMTWMRRSDHLEGAAMNHPLQLPMHSPRPWRPVLNIRHAFGPYDELRRRHYDSYQMQQP